MGGSLCVIQAADPRFHDDGSHARDDSGFADIRGPQNTGGNW